MTNKEIASIISAFTLACGSLYSADVYHIHNVKGTPLTWSDSIWSIGDYVNYVPAEYCPGYYDELTGIDTRDAILMFPGGGCDHNLFINVDDNYTVSGITNEHGQFGINLDMRKQLENGTVDSSITFKAVNVAAGATTYNFIKVAGGGDASTNPPTYTTFHGGTVKLTGLSDGVEAVVSVCNNAVSQPQQRVSNTLTFSESTTFISESDLRLNGDSSSTDNTFNLNSTINLNGTTIIGKNTGTDKEPVWDYKKLTISYGNNPCKAPSLTTNIGGELTASHIKQHYNNIVNVSGTVTANAELTTWSNGYSDSNVAALHISGEVNVKEGGHLKATGEAFKADSSRDWFGASAYVEGGGKLVFEKGSKGTFENALRSTSYSSTSKAIIDIQNGAEVNAAAAWIGGNTEFNIGGKFTITDSYMYVYGNKTVLNIQKGADVFASTITLAYSTLKIDSGVAEGALKTNRIEIDNNDARLILNSTNAIVNAGTLKAEDFLIEALIGDCYLDINASQNFKALKFRSQAARDGITAINFNVSIGADVEYINLLTLCENTLFNPDDEALLDRYLVIDGFRNNLIHVDQKDTIIDFSLISSKDGNWKDFNFVEDVNGGYWLNATQIPEPSTYAIILGLAVFGVALIRRRK